MPAGMTARRKKKACSDIPNVPRYLRTHSRIPIALLPIDHLELGLLPSSSSSSMTRRRQPGHTPDGLEMLAHAAATILFSSLTAQYVIASDVGHCSGHTQLAGTRLDFTQIYKL